MSPPDASASFVVLRADLPVGSGLRLVGELRPAFVVVHRREQPDPVAYHLYTADELRRNLGLMGPGVSLEAALRLEGSTATPLEAPDEPMVSDQAVLHANGLVVGVRDVRRAAQKGRPAPVAAPGPPTTRGGEEERPGGGERPRSLVAEFPDAVDAHSVRSLLVSLVVGPAARGLDVRLPVGAEVHVVVVAKEGFVVEGDGEGSLLVTDEPATLPLRFALRALDAGPGEIRVLAFHRTRSLGAITLRPTIVADAAAALPVAHRQTMAPIEVQRPVPDLDVLITEENADPSLQYVMRLQARDPALRLVYSKFGPLTLRTDARAYFRDFFAEIEGLPATTERERATMVARLAARGADLFTSVFPRDLQEQLWRIRDRIQSIVIQSEEPWIPWELCKLVGVEDGRVVEDAFLCQRYRITRWVPGRTWSPLRLRNLALVVPGDSGLPDAKRERDLLLSLRDTARDVTVIPATYVDVLQAFASGRYDGWHFTGHAIDRAEDANRSAIVLEGGDQLTPMDIAGRVANLGAAAPLVFLNACQSGRGGFALTSVGGWANRFLDAGAAAFVGTYWSVTDRPAVDFAAEVYRQLLAGQPVGEAVRAARAAIRRDDDPTWLAYTVFADPLAAVAEDGGT